MQILADLGKLAFTAFVGIFFMRVMPRSNNSRTIFIILFGIAMGLLLILLGLDSFRLLLWH